MKFDDLINHYNYNTRDAIREALGKLPLYRWEIDETIQSSDTTTYLGLTNSVLVKAHVILHGDELHSKPSASSDSASYRKYEGLFKRVIFNDPATIVFWNDGTKTVVKADREPYDPEKGLAMCIAKKFLGNDGSYYEIFKKYIKEDE